MGKCLQCHQGGDGAPATCATCHLTDIGQIKVPDRYPKVRIEERATCEGCHSLDACRSCHGLDMPHPEGFVDPQQHARLAAFEKKEELCFRCHEPELCASCHTINQPGSSQANWGHQPGWRDEHRTRSADECRACHTEAGSSMCRLCHES
jgi:hypothetical protein